MLTLKTIRSNPEEVISCLKIKNFEAGEIIQSIIELDDNRKETQSKQDQLQQELNEISKEIGLLIKSGKNDEARTTKNKTVNIKEALKKLHQTSVQVERSLKEQLVRLPNLPNKLVSPGRGEEDNIIIRSGGKVPSLPEEAIPHWELGKQYHFLDFDLGNKITGAGFPVYMGKGAMLQRALIRFFLSEAIQAGYEEIIPPLMVNEDSAFSTGQLPDKEGQMYFVGQDIFYLIPTAEVPVTNIYRDRVLDANDFPIKNTAYTPCFRREAGSYGKDVRGLNRVHQFDKVEIVQIQHPEYSYKALEEMISHVEGLLVKLNLPYRIVRLCGGDLSFTSAITYDFEVYAGAQKKWLEVSSVSNFESFQANRLKLRFKEKGNKKTQLAHTLNGSALALPRVVAALLENNQSSKGIKMPEILVPYLGFDYIN